MKRSRSDDDLDRALALSLAEQQQQQAHEDELSRAVAQSLAEADPELPRRRPGDWDCTRCTWTNAADVGRCASCASDRYAPFAASPSANTETRCGLPGCARPKRVRDYCCEEHERRAIAAGTAAPIDRGTHKVVFGASGDHAYHLLTRHDEARERVRRRFLEHWAKDAPGASDHVALPRVERLYRIEPSPQLKEQHEAYAHSVGNRRERFHGTGARCDFGIDDKEGVRPCADAACSLCSIAARGFRLARSGTGPNFPLGRFATASGLRYGPGLYFSATSGKSHDYAGGSERRRGGRRWRTMFLASVAAGRAHKVYDEFLDIERPPDGCDSVVGESKAKGGCLNYDELVVYRERAALPQFLIVYSLAP